MTTQPTPEQLAKWHREAKFAYGCDNTITVSGDPYSAYITGYLRAKQETEVKQLDDRRIAEAVNNLTLIAREFHAQGSLRQRISGVVVDLVQGLLRDKQETEQAMKLAKFGAMVTKSHADGYLIETDDLSAALLASGCAVEPINGKIDYAPNIEATIKELLK